MTISWRDFEAVDMRVGVVVKAREFAAARRPAYQLLIDFGPLGVKRSSARITDLHPAELIGRPVIGVVNFAPKQIGPFVSEVLVLGAYTESGSGRPAPPRRPRGPRRPDRLTAARPVRDRRVRSPSRSAPPAASPSSAS